MEKMKDDVIYRQDAIDAIENAFDRETILNRFVRKIAISAVRLLPSAQPERPKGEWITDDLSGIISCSRCGNVAPVDTTGGRQYKSKFCQTCGADMKMADDAQYFVDVEEALNMAISAQPEPQWIPCSERLPEAEDCPMDCLVTRKSKYIGNYTDMEVCEKNGMWTHEDWDAIVLGDVKDGKSTGLISTRDDDIIAWMPLPEPYKGGEQDENR